MRRLCVCVCVCARARARACVRVRVWYVWYGDGGVSNCVRGVFDVCVCVCARAPVYLFAYGDVVCV